MIKESWTWFYMQTNKQKNQLEILHMNYVSNLKKNRCNFFVFINFWWWKIKAMIKSRINYLNELVNHDNKFPTILNKKNSKY